MDSLLENKNQGFYEVELDDGSLATMPDEDGGPSGIISRRMKRGGGFLETDQAGQRVSYEFDPSLRGALLVKEFNGWKGKRFFCVWNGQAIGANDKDAVALVRSAFGAMALAKWYRDGMKGNPPT